MSPRVLKTGFHLLALQAFVRGMLTRSRLQAARRAARLSGPDFEDGDDSSSFSAALCFAESAFGLPGRAASGADSFNFSQADPWQLTAFGGSAEALKIATVYAQHSTESDQSFDAQQLDRRKSETEQSFEALQLNSSSPPQLSSGLQHRSHEPGKISMLSAAPAAHADLEQDCQSPSSSGPGDCLQSLGDGASISRQDAKLPLRAALDSPPAASAAQHVPAQVDEATQKPVHD